MITGEVGKILGERWKALNEKQKAPYDAKAAADKKRYEEEKAAYTAVSVDINRSCLAMMLTPACRAALMMMRTRTRSILSCHQPSMTLLPPCYPTPLRLHARDFIGFYCYLACMDLRRWRLATALQKHHAHETTFG